MEMPPPDCSQGSRDVLPEMPGCCTHPNLSQWDSMCSDTGNVTSTGKGEGKDCILVLILKFNPAAFASAQGQKMREGAI